MIGPGLLVAATGVGAGDLATASIAGSKLGVTILWAVLLGAFLKFVLTEGLTIPTAALFALALWRAYRLRHADSSRGRPLRWLVLAVLLALVSGTRGGGGFSRGGGTKGSPGGGFSGGGGSFFLGLDLNDTPQPGGSVAIVAGETWNFQAWFRDMNPGPTSNFTDGVSVLFQ